MRNRTAFEILESAARAGIWSLDLNTDKLWFSPGIYAIVGLDPAEQLPNIAATFALYEPASRRQLQQALECSRREGVGWDLKLTLQRPDGIARTIRVVAEPVVQGGDAVRLVGAFFDVDIQHRERLASEGMAKYIADQRSRWQFAVRASGLGMWEWDAEADQVDYSDQWHAMLGYAPGELDDQQVADWWQRVHADDLDRCRTDMEAHVCGETEAYKSEHRLRCKDGSYRWMLDRGQVVKRDAAGRPRRIIGTIYDIHDRKTAEAALAHSEWRLRAIFNRMFQFTGMLRPDGTVIEMNDAALRSVGGGREAVVGLPLWQTPWFRYSEADRARLQEGVRKAQSGEFVRFNVDVYGDDDGRSSIDFSLTPFRDESGEIALLIPEGRDITKLLATQSALKESQMLFQQTFDQAPIGLGLVDTDARWLSVNRELLDILGYTQEEVLGQSIYQVIHPDDSAGVRACAQRTLAGHCDSYRYQRRYVHRDGHRIHAQVDVSLLRDQQQKPIHFIVQVQDITQQLADQEALSEAKELAQVTLAAIDEGIIRVDSDNRISFCNRAASRLLGCESQAMVGAPFSDSVRLFGSVSDVPVPDPVAAALRTGVNLRVPDFTRVLRADGSYLPIAISASPVRNRDGDAIGAVFAFQDMSETQRMTQELAEQALRDDLTGLPNRRSFAEALDSAWRAARNGGDQSVLLYLDLDQFKTVNDTCGHLAGDDMLRAVGKVIRGHLRSEDRLFRLGGDEFAAIVVQHQGVAEQVADKLIAAVTAYEFMHEGRDYRVGVSIGLAAVDGDAKTPTELQGRADTALYVAKEAGRRRWHSYRSGDPEIQQARRSLDIALQIQRALDRDGFELHLQAIVDGARNVCGYEALIRLRQDDGALMPPDHFLPAANRLALMGRVDAWVARAALGLLRRRLQAGRWVPNCYLAINLSPSSACDPLFSETLLNLLETWAIPADAVRFEITETEELGDAGSAMLVQALRSRNYRVWIDDFGSGFNSFELLKRFRVDGIKIDRAFIADPLDNPVNRTLVESAAQVGHKLQLEIVAEGVETEACLESLRRLSITRFQGYLFHRPEPADDALAAVAPGGKIVRSA